MKISYADVNFTKNSGDVTVTSHTVQVTPKDIEVWKREPTAVFNTLGWEPSRRFVLDSYEVPH